MTNETVRVCLGQLQVRAHHAGFQSDGFSDSTCSLSKATSLVTGSTKKTEIQALLRSPVNRRSTNVCSTAADSPPLQNTPERQPPKHKYVEESRSNSLQTAETVQLLLL